MKKTLFFVASMVLFFSCASENENTMYVKGNIKGLIKGTLYLQKQIDSLIVTVDSVNVSGSSEFILTDIIDTPEMYFLVLGKSNKRISFFGEKDSITIRSNLDKFELKSVISGSENQDVLDQYYDFKKKFNNQNLDLIKKEFEVLKSKNQDSITIVRNQLKGLVKRRYLYTINYVITNSNMEAAPYIALTELYDTSFKMLDTINNSLTPKVKNSKYGKQLNELIIERNGK